MKATCGVDCLISEANGRTIERVRFLLSRVCNGDVSELYGIKNNRFPLWLCSLPVLSIGSLEVDSI